MRVRNTIGPATPDDGDADVVNQAGHVDGHLVQARTVTGDVTITRGGTGGAIQAGAVTGKIVIK